MTLGWAGFVVLDDCLWCAGGFVLGLVLYLGFGMGTLAVYLFVCTCQFAEVASDALCPNLLLQFCRWDNLVPICISPVLVLLNWGLTDLGPGVQSLLQAVWDLLWWQWWCGGRGNWPILPQFKEITRYFPSLRPGGTCTNRGIF